MATEVAVAGARWASPREPSNARVTPQRVPDPGRSDDHQRPGCMATEVAVAGARWASPRETLQRPGHAPAGPRPGTIGWPPRRGPTRIDLL